jgi:hypothetical protein
MSSTIFVALVSLHQPKPRVHWWQGDWKKEIPAVKKALAEAEGKQTATGYEDKKILLPLLREATNESRMKSNEVNFVRLAALVYRGRNAPGIENEPVYVNAKSQANLVLFGWDKRVDSLSFIRMCTIYHYRINYDGYTPELDFIKKIRPFIKDDPVFDECLVYFMSFRYQSFEKNDILNEARKLAQQPRAIYTNAREAGYAFRTVAFFNRDKKIMNESIAMLQKYRSGMQVVDPNEKKRLDQHIRFLKETSSKWD